MLCDRMIACALAHHIHIFLGKYVSSISCVQWGWWLSFKFVAAAFLFHPIFSSLSEGNCSNHLRRDQFDGICILVDVVEIGVKWRFAHRIWATNINSDLHKQGRLSGISKHIREKENKISSDKQITTKQNDNIIIMDKENSVRHHPNNCKNNCQTKNNNHNRQP